MEPLGVTLRQLEYFVATVELGTFSAAGARYHISQSAVSLAVTDLEKALKVQLLVRRPAKGPALTGAGRELLEAARRVLAEARDLEAVGLGEGTEVSGRLVVGSFPTITPYVMGPLLEGIQRQNSRLTVELVEDSVEGLQRRLRDGSCDVAILYDLAIADGIVATPLYACRPYALLPGDHPLAGQRSVDIAQLIDEPMIMIDLPPSWEYFHGVLTRAGLSPTVRYRAGSIETVRALVGRGLGWSMLLHRPVPNLSYDGARVATPDIDGLEESVDILLARASGIRLTGRVRAFGAFCREQLCDQPQPSS